MSKVLLVLALGGCFTTTMHGPRLVRDIRISGNELEVDACNVDIKERHAEIVVILLLPLLILGALGGAGGGGGGSSNARWFDLHDCATTTHSIIGASS